MVSVFSGNTIEGEILQSICCDFNLQQFGNKPTRGQYLLDLVMTNLPDCKIEVLPMIADHQCVLVHVPMRICLNTVTSRWGWIYSQANWPLLRRTLQETDWSFIFRLPLDDAVERFQLTILAEARKCIPMKRFSESKGQHPWLNDLCRHAIAQKHAAEGTLHYMAKRDECSSILMD